ncbi:MAG: HNH endonuclease, partial [Actinomycetota bacterium]
SPCQRMHNAKTHGGWTLQQPQPGTFVWTSPTGRVYRRRARPLVPGRRERRGSDTGDDDPASSA